MGIIIYALLIGMVGVALVYRKSLFRIIVRGKTVPLPFKPSAVSQKGKRVLIVGGTKGIGLALAQLFVKDGAIVKVAGRTRPSSPLHVDWVQADLRTVRAQRAFVAGLERVDFDTVLFTQGIFAPPAFVDNGEGIELDLAISSLSRLVILHHLITRGFQGRVFVMAYPGQELKPKNFNNVIPEQYSLIEQHMNTIVANDAIVLDEKKRGRVDIYGTMFSLRRNVSLSLTPKKKKKPSTQVSFKQTFEKTCTLVR